jgi:hypothetical protein
MWSNEGMVNPSAFIQLLVCVTALVAGLWSLSTAPQGSRRRRAAGWGISVGATLGTLAGTLAYVYMTGLKQYT